MTAANPQVDVTQRKPRLDFIDVLRALAVLAVFCVHVHGYWVRPFDTRGPGSS